MFDREMLRSAFVSLFWAVISYRKKRGDPAQSAPSRWFSGERPNWTLNTIADIAGALDVEIEIRATDRRTGVVFTPSGVVYAPGERDV